MTYTNPWAKDNEPKIYTRNAVPVDYKDCQIVKVNSNQYDVVKSGVCIGQRGGLEGAKKIADLVKDMDNPTYEDVRERQFNPIGELFA